MIVKPYVYKALREELKTHDNGKIQNLRGFGSLSLRPRIRSIFNDFLLRERQRRTSDFWSL